jgi:HipA N-terminal domain
LPLREDRYIGDPVINVFDNLLPDRDAVRRRVAERVGAEGIDPFSLLTALGHDCVGALQFLQDGIDPGVAGAINGNPVSDDEIRPSSTILRSRRSALATTMTSESRSPAHKRKRPCCAETANG